MQVKFNTVYILKKISYHTGIYIKDMDIIAIMHIFKAIRLGVSWSSNKYEFCDALRVLAFYFALFVN